MIIVVNGKQQLIPLWNSISVAIDWLSLLHAQQQTGVLQGICMELVHASPAAHALSTVLAPPSVERVLEGTILPMQVFVPSPIRHLICSGVAGNLSGLKCRKRIGIAWLAGTFEFTANSMLASLYSRPLSG
jgi:hypothetical protein